MKNYRTPFLLAFAVNLLLAAALAFFWWRSHSPNPETPLRAMLPEAIRSVLPESAQPAEQTAPPAPFPANQPDLVPIQISAQRLQSIGVKRGRVQRRSVA